MPSTSAPADVRPAAARRGLRLSAEGIAKAFPSADGPILALAGVDTTIEAGEFVSMLGPSGCGKSTLMAIMAGLEPATCGTVTVDGRAVTSPLVEAGVMFQRDLLLDWRTCEKNILLQFEMRGQSAAPHRERARELLELVGVAQFANRFPRELSGGMRQRVAICRALVHDPPVLFMDEPFGALDALTRESLNSELAKLTGQSGTTVVFVTHSIDEAVFLSDRVLVMSRRPGQIVGDVRIELPRPRGLEVHSLPQFADYAQQLRHLLVEHGGLEEAGDA
ncbi:MAG TPA: ABC transporter ATP-binding protein [Conexibacter sp.]|nr:ABC transporter ATP-binding protein [Conexibacter sp.]